ncbi:MAG: LysR family transcriptional regulator [Myxococcota bacterium]
MRLEGLAVLCRVRSEGSINGAARALQIAPSTAWRRLQQLEEDLGCALLERSTAHVRLTQAGHEAARHGEQLLQGADALRDAAQAADHGAQGELRVAIVPTSALDPVFPAWDRLSELRPGLRVVLVESPDPKHPLRDDFDLVVTHTVPRDDGLFVQRLATQPLGLFASPAYPRPLPATPDDLAEHELALHYLPPEPADVVPGRPPLAVAPVLATTSASVVAQWVRSGRGLGWMASPIEGGLVPVLAEVVGGDRPLYLVAGLRQRDSARLRLVRDIVDWLGAV